MSVVRPCRTNVPTGAQTLQPPGLAPVSSARLPEPQAEAGAAPVPARLTWQPAARRRGAGGRARAGDFAAVGVHAPAEAGAAVTLQGQEAAALIALGDVRPAAGGGGVLGLGLALPLFTGGQP